MAEGSFGDAGQDRQPRRAVTGMTAAVRRLGALCLAAVVACTGEVARPQREPPPTPGLAPGQTGSPPIVAGARYRRLVCRLPREHIRRLQNGYFAGRSGEIQFVLRPPHFFQGYSHSGPSSALQRVPLLLYGPGHVPSIGTVRRPTTLTSVAPTLARYLGYDFDTPDGEPLDEAVLPGQEPPKLVMVVVWDAAGRNVLDEHAAEWAAVRGLIPNGAWFENATVGTTPSMTPPVHATIGTGVYPRRHGIIDFVMGKGDELVGSTGSGPQSLMVPTLADLYDRDRGNRPLIGLVAWEPTLGMIGHGSFLEGGDQDLVLATKQGEWGLSPENRRHFRFEGYVETIGGLHQEAARQDLEDGRLDGQWLGQSLATALDIEYTPAYSRYQTQVLAEVIRREGFGHDDVPDLLFTNYKQIDRVAHVWSFPGQHMRAVVAAVAQELMNLIRFLDGEVGKGQWVLALTADHGTTPLASETGAFTINRDELQADMVRALDTDGDPTSVIRRILETQLWMNVSELEDNGHTLQEVADFLMAYTIGDNAPDPSAIPGHLGDERLFRAAFPGTVLSALPCLPVKD
jgi:Type I phosphodiesterase / nucleotide pyrophosphatase